MKINVIGVPLNLGCDREGVERAPNHLRERGLMRIIRKNGHRAFDLGNLYVPLVSEADKFARGRSLKYLDAIVEVNNNLAELVYDTLRGGAFPLVIGGDHSLGLGSASGVGKSFDDFGIIWLDAHGDINTSETSPSGNIHGMPLSALMGMGSEELVNIYAPGNKVNPQNVFLVGTRSLDEGEQALIEREQLSVYTMDMIHLKGIGFVAEDIKRKLKERKTRYRDTRVRRVDAGRVQGFRRTYTIHQSDQVDGSGRAESRTGCERSDDQSVLGHNRLYNSPFVSGFYC